MHSHTDQEIRLRWQAFILRVRYKKGFRFTAAPSGQHLSLGLVTKVQDATDLSRIVEHRFEQSIRPWEWPGLITAAEWVRDLVYDYECHEADEWLKVESDKHGTFLITDNHRRSGYGQPLTEFVLRHTDERLW